jgi:nicotinamide-nucleotide amidase
MVEEIAGLASRIGRRLKKRGWSISVAESCTGGLICSTFTDISGSSAWFKQGWVVYTNESKISEVDVSPTAFDADGEGAVSHKVALQMAHGARHHAGTEVSLSITGIAGPTGGTESKEVGLVYVAVTTHDGRYIVRRNDFGSNDRIENKRSFVQFALRMVLEILDHADDIERRRKRAEERKLEDEDSGSPGEDDWEGAEEWAPKGTSRAEPSSVDFSVETDWD